MKDNEQLKASRAAAEVAFMLAQVSLNLEHLPEDLRGQFAQPLASIRHDLSVIAHQAGIINSQIMEAYEQNKNHHDDN